METLSLAITDGVALVRLEQPAVRNAISLRMADEMAAAFDALEADERVGAVVVTGEGRAFCAGADLAVLERADRDAFHHIYAAFLRVLDCPLPTIGAINGAAAGAGLNLALACDIRIATPRAKFITRFLDIGLHSGGGHTWMLQRAVGRERALAMLLCGEEPDGAQAAAIGLALRCVPEDELLDVCTAMATRAAEHPRALVKRTKATVDAVAALGHHADALAVETDAQMWSSQQPFFKERIGALRASMAAKGDGR